YFDLDPALVRVAWAVLIFATAGTFFLLYVVIWIVVPEAPPGYVSPAETPRPAGPEAAATPDSAGGETAGASPAGPSIADEWWARRGERRHYRSGGGGL